MVQSATPSAHCLVDLYLPARLGTAAELVAALTAARFGAAIVVSEEGEESVTLESNAEVRLVPGFEVTGPGYRFVVVVPPGKHVARDVLEAAGQAELVQAAVRSLGGVAVPVAPRQTAGGGVSHAVAGLGGEVPAAIVLTIAGSPLGRDLDIEDAALAERRIYAGSGPFAALGDVGRFATLLPIERRGADFEVRLIAALRAGLGIAIERKGREEGGVAGRGHGGGGGRGRRGGR